MAAQEQALQEQHMAAASLAEPWAASVQALVADISADLPEVRRAAGHKADNRGPWAVAAAVYTAADTPDT